MIVLHHNLTTIHLVPVHLVHRLLHAVGVLELNDAAAARLSVLIVEQLGELDGADDAAEQVLQILPAVLVRDVRHVDALVNARHTAIACSAARRAVVVVAAASAGVADVREAGATVAATRSVALRRGRLLLVVHCRRRSGRCLCDGIRKRITFSQLCIVFGMFVNAPACASTAQIFKMVAYRNVVFQTNIPNSEE